MNLRNRVIQVDRKPITSPEQIPSVSDSCFHGSDMISDAESDTVRTDDFHLESRKRKRDLSEASCEGNFSGIRPADNLASKRLKIEAEMQIDSSGDDASGVDSQKIKKQNASLAKFLTTAEIEAHLASFTQQKDVLSGNKMHSVGQTTCQLCSMDKLVFAPAPIYCSSCQYRIKQNVGYYQSADKEGTRYCFCTSCFKGCCGAKILVHGISISKANLQKAKNNEGKEDSRVLCDRCQNWQHRTCGLYNDEIDAEGKQEYICPKCCLEEIETGKHIPVKKTVAFGAKDLPKTSLSNEIEERLTMRLKKERGEMANIAGIKPEEVPGAEDLVVRVVASVDKQLEVRQQFRNILHGEDYPAEFSYTSKFIVLFQKIEGIDVFLFGMCVQEFGPECGGPNHRSVYISYIDSVNYFRPRRKTATGESLRTFVYHEVLIGYLNYCKKRGFETCYLWAYPPAEGDDYIFYCHPNSQKTPKQDKLWQWYKSMLKKAVADDVVMDYTNLYNQFFILNGEDNTKITAARLPYFDGDYWSRAAENIVTELEKESRVGLKDKMPSKRTLKAMGQDSPDVAMKDVLVMQKLGETILPVKENFIIIRLQHTCHCGESNQLSEVEGKNGNLDHKDKEAELVNSFLESGKAFLLKCQESHFQFDTLARAKYSSMMILYRLNACHMHKLTKHSRIADSGTKIKEPQKQKRLTSKEVVEGLIHTCQCRNSRCSDSLCSRIRKLLQHAALCKVMVHGGCKFCRLAWSILEEHSGKRF